jgi:hypothetical protein
VEVPPPEGGGGGGGGGGTTTGPTTSSDTGTVTTTGNSSILTVDGGKIAQLLEQRDVNEINLAVPGTNLQQGTVAVAADTLADCFQAGKTVNVTVGGVRLSIPPNALDLSAFAEQGVTLDISVTKADPSTAPPADSTAYMIAGQVYYIQIRAVSNGTDRGEISTFSSPVTLTMSYDRALVGDIPEEALQIYRWNGVSWDDMGGTLDAANQQISVSRDSLSIYAVMAPKKSFADVKGHWAEKDILIMVARRVVFGISANTFDPDGHVTRAQFAAMLLRAVKIKEQSGNGKFKDVGKDAWYAGAVATAVEKHLAGGYPDGTFKPNAYITREELAFMINQALAYEGQELPLSASGVNEQLSPFKDAGKISSWSRPAMASIIKQGIIKGRTEDQCAPQATATRAEAVVMLKNMLKATGEF